MKSIRFFFLRAERPFCLIHGDYRILGKRVFLKRGILSDTDGFEILASHERLFADGGKAFQPVVKGECALADAYNVCRDASTPACGKQGVAFTSLFQDGSGGILWGSCPNTRESDW